MTLPDIILKFIPPAMLERVVFDQGKIDATRHADLFKASGLLPEEIARKTVEAYGSESSRLAWGLYEQISETDWETARLLFDHFKSRPEILYYNHQASLVGRIPTLPLAELSSFLETVKGHVCLIVSRKGNANPVVRGTGFLVAPNLVLTCRHVLKSFLPDEDVLANGYRIEFYFDFFNGDPVEDVGAVIPRAKKVGLARDWHVASGSHTSPDGLTGELNEEDRARISKSLDFILVRLDQPVGLQPLKQGGGRRRRWIEFAPDNVPQGLQGQDWIIIPQHPYGFPQRIDLGRFQECDQTGTRIRYSTNTAKGTSGAPCFNQKFHLVGVHNAYVGPEAKPFANQAIRCDLIAAVVRPHITNLTNVNRDARRWAISKPSEAPRVIIGRDQLLAWLEASATRNPRTLADRVYVAQANVAGAGCTFSCDVLHAHIRDSKTPRAVYGSAGQQLPDMAEDFLVSLLRELGIAKSPIPERPGASARETSDRRPPPDEMDKLVRWLSEELPNWLGDVITAHVEKEIDARLAARQAFEIYKQQGLEATAEAQELREKADAGNPIPVRPNPWDFAYVVIDDLRASTYHGTGARTGFAGEVLTLIAALVKGKPEQAMHPGLRRLRWMFLGYLPDFIPVDMGDGNGATIETLDPATTGVKEILGVFERMSDAHLQLGQGLAVARASVEFIAKAARPGTPETRLLDLQETVSAWSAKLLEEIGS